MLIRQARLISGLVMLTYISMHFLNHAAGLISISAMERMLLWVKGVWTPWPGQSVLYTSFLVHYLLALLSLWQRRTLRMRPAEFAQIVLGFAIPIMLARHVVNNRIGAAAFHTTIQNYTFELWGFFVHDPVRGYLQLLVLVIAWSHAMLGLHFWLRVQPWYARCQALALSVAVLTPVLALLGVAEAGHRIAEMAQDPAWRDAAFTYMVFPTPAETATQELVTGVLTWGFAGVIVVLLAARLVRRAWE